MKRAAIIPIAALMLAACHEEVMEPGSRGSSTPPVLDFVGARHWIASGSWPAISGNLIVWTGPITAYNIYLCEWNGSSCSDPVQIASGGWGPTISGNLIVWREGFSSSWDMYLCEWNGSSCSDPVHITSGANGHRQEISGNLIVWDGVVDGHSGVHACEWNGSTCPVVQINNPAVGEQGRPTVSGNLIVWEGTPVSPCPSCDTYPSLFMCEWNGSSCSDPVLIVRDIVMWPAISGNLIVWEDHWEMEGNGDITLCEWNGISCSVFPVTSDRLPQMRPGISGNLIAWLVEDSGNYGDIYLCEWNGTSCSDPVQITTEPYASGRPNISGNRIVWSEYPDIYLYDLEPLAITIDINAGSASCVNPMSGGRIAVAVLASGSFDPAQIDVSTVQLGGVSPVPCWPPWRECRYRRPDVNDDGLNDLVMDFNIQDLNDAGLLTDGNILTLTGSLLDGTPFEGSDVVYLAGGPYCADLFGVNSHDDGLSRINPETGVATFIGPLDPDPNVYVTPIAMAVRPSDGKIFVWNNSDRDPNTGTTIVTGVLLTLDPATGLATRVDATTPNQGQLFALAFAPDGRLFGLERELYEIDPATGILTTIGSLGLSVAGADFDASGTLYGLELLGTERLVTIDINTGTTTVVGTLNPDIVAFAGSIVFDPTGTLIGSARGQENHVLFDIDPGTAAVSNVRVISGGSMPQGMGFEP